MAVTNQQIIDYLLANPGLSDAQIVASMEQYGISPSQMASAVGIPEGQIAARVAATVPPGNSVTLGDTVIVPQYRTTGSGMDEQILGLESFATSKSNGDPNYKAPVGTPMQVYSADGAFVDTVKTKKDQSFFGGLVDALKDPVVLAAIGGAAAGGLFGGAGALGGGATALTAAEAAGLGLTAAEAASLGLSATEFAAATGAAGATGLLSPAATSAVAPTVAGTTAVAPTVAGTTAATGAASTIPAATAATTAATALTPAAVSALNPTVASIASSLIPTAVKGLLTPDVISGATSTAGNLLQSQTSKAAAEKAAADINAATQAGVTASQFRPVGMTTRFGTSNYTYDPKTGQMVSAGYQLSPEAKNAQDRLVKLAESGLQQAEGAQQQFAPLQTGAQGLFKLGNQYIAESPQDVAQNYLNQQMALLQPGREVELANLQNRLQQQGRAGLSVAQGGTMGATTPELQALYNARAQQEAQLAANAQQYGQQNVLFGAGLLGQGATAMGNYYGGQQQAYSPYTTALGQVQGLETAAQQPLMLGAQLGQQSATAGANAGRLGVLGTQAAGNILTGNDATYNPYAGLLTAAGSPTSMFGQAAAQWLTGGVPAQTAMSAPATSYGAGNYYGNQDVLGTWGV